VNLKTTIESFTKECLAKIVRTAELFRKKLFLRSNKYFTIQVWIWCRWEFKEKSM